MVEIEDLSGVIKCQQNPQLFFHMTEVMEFKKLELNEKVEFSVIPVSSDDAAPIIHGVDFTSFWGKCDHFFVFFFTKHETAEGGSQAIRIKRLTERVFLPVPKLGGVGTQKIKV